MLIVMTTSCMVQGAKLPVDRRPSSPAPPVYQEEYESFFDREGMSCNVVLNGYCLASVQHGI